MSQNEPEIVKLFRASPVGDQVIPRITIEIDEEVPEICSLETYLREHRRMYTGQGEKLVAALLRSLPGGTIDAILASLLEYRASLLRTPFVPSKEGPSDEHGQ